MVLIKLDEFVDCVNKMAFEKLKEPLMAEAYAPFCHHIAIRLKREYEGLKAFDDDLMDREINLKITSPSIKLELTPSELVSLPLDNFIVDDLDIIYTRIEQAVSSIIHMHQRAKEIRKLVVPK